MPRKRNHKRAVARGPSRLGRPRQPGERYKGGKLKPCPPEPNARVLADRLAMVTTTDKDGKAKVGDLTKASSPMDFALERGWITQAQHRAGAAYVSLYGASEIQGPRAGNASYGEVDERAAIDKRSLAQMSPFEIVEAFDRVLAKTSAGAQHDAQTAAAMVRWRQINAAMSPDQQREVFAVCVMDSWPQWVIQRAAGHMDTSWERKRTVLIAGLDGIGAALRPAKAPQPPTSTDPAPRIEPIEHPQGRKVAEVTSYVDSDGKPLYEAVVIKRRT